MTIQTHALSDLDDKAAAGTALSRDEAERVIACPDLVSVGLLGESSRKARHRDRVTFGRVCEVGPDSRPESAGDALEVRVVGAPESIDAARERVRDVVKWAAGHTITGYSAADLLALVSGDHLALADLAAALVSDGLAAVAETPLDQLGDTENAIEVVRALTHGGLGVWRATVADAAGAPRLDLIDRAQAIAEVAPAFKAFAPLARHDSRETPSTGYDDVRLVAVARLRCVGIPSIQVDWPLYGPKLAQVAIAFGADDIDGVAGVDALHLGLRRSPAEDIARQIRAAGATPVERTPHYETRA
jgi:aminodeoxyfutalosine synthase